MAYVNIIMRTKTIPNIYKDDSIKKYNFSKKYSKIMLNPPYGIKFDYN
jgi:hypothetical protein